MRAWRSLLGCAAIAVRGLAAQQDVPADKAHVADAVRADLAKLTDLERGYFAANKRFTVDAKALHFTPKSGAVIAVSYASARSFSASASDARLAPFLCFVIVSSADGTSPAEKPFCTDSRYGTAATALARAGSELDAPPPAVSSPKTAQKSVTSVTVGVTDRVVLNPDEHTSRAPAITPSAFADRLRTAVAGRNDSSLVIVQFAVKEARYDPSRGVLEVAVDRVPLPLAKPQSGDSATVRPALTCFTRPAFVCGASGLSYIARDLLRVPASRAPDLDVLHSGLTLDAHFIVGRRDGTVGPALTLLALVLQAKGVVVASWDAATGR